MKSKYKKEKNKRYYLHSVVRSQGYKLDVPTKSIEVDHTFDESTMSTQLRRLISEYGYNLQLCIV